MALTEPELDRIGMLLVANNKALVAEMKEVFVEQKTAYKWAVGGLAWAAGNLIVLLFFFFQVMFQKLPHA